MAMRFDELPLEEMPVEMSRGLAYNSPSLLNYADKVNKEAGLPPGLMRGTIERGEKSGSMSTSPKGAKGVGQFIKETASRYGLDDPTDPRASIDAMGKYYQNAVKVTGSSDPAILAAAYNSGENRKELKEGKIPNIKETKDYVTRVTAGLPSQPKGMSYAEATKMLAKEEKEKESVPVSPMVQNLNPEGKQVTSAAAAFGKSVIEGLAPAISGLATFGTGMAAGAAVAAPFAALTGPAFPAVEAIAGIAGGMATSFGASYLTRQAQDYLVGSLPNGLLKAMGMDKETRAQEEKDSPNASFAGSLASNLVAFKPGISTVKNAVAMAGLGGGMEAARELVADGELDPFKIGLSAVFQGAVSNPNKLGRKVLDATAWHPLPKLTPREEYVNEVTKKLGPGFKETAEQMWDKQENSHKPPSNTLSASGTLKENVDAMQDAQFALKQQKDAGKLGLIDSYKEVPVMELVDATGENVYHAQPGEQNHQGPMQQQRVGTSPTKALTPEEAYANKRWVEPARLVGADLHKKIRVMAGEEVAAQFDEHNVRMPQQTWVSKIVKMGDSVMGAAGFARTPGSENSRNMLAIERPNGKREVVHVDGREVKGFDAQKKPYSKVNLPTAPRVGDYITVGGGKVKLVEATTAEIESQTGIRYNKNAFANNLFMNEEMRGFIREKQWLDKTVDTLEMMGYAVPKSETARAPKGFRGVQGDNKLEKFWVKDEIAYTFEDGIMKNSSPTSRLEQFNQAAIGTIFWNPAPHLFNAFDHWVGTVGFDLLKPWQYKSIGKSMVDAYKDVKNLTPAYRDYMNSGMGLNYGRIAAEKVYEKMLNGIEPQSMASLAKSWGMHPTKLVESIYAGAKTGLWAGSDIMMVSAYKHMASKQGVSIFNKALRNYVEAHNPNYRVPSQIGFDSFMKIPGMPEAAAKAISRGVSLGMQSRAFNTFGRYHYGQFRSLGQSMHDIVIQNEKSVSGRAKALEHAAFTGFALTVLYPYIWDTIAKVVSGDASAQMRRAGASTIPYTGWHMVLGDESVRKLISEAYSLPPITKALVELPSNMNLFTGRHIWEPEDNMLGQANDIGLYVSGQIVAPIKLAHDAAYKPGKTAASQLGIQTERDKVEELREKRQKRDKSAAKSRQKVRGYFEDEE